MSKKDPKKKSRPKPISVVTVLSKAPRSESSRKRPKRESVQEHFASATYRDSGVTTKLKRIAEDYRERLVSEWVDDWGKRRIDWLKRRILSSRAANALQTWIESGTR